MTIPCPQFEHVEELDRGVLQTVPENGPVRTSKRREHKIRTFHLNWDRASKVYADQLQAQYIASSGTLKSFSYTPTVLLEVVATTVKFKKDQSLVIEWMGPDHYKMSCVLEELLKAA